MIITSGVAMIDLAYVVLGIPLLAFIMLVVVPNNKVAALINIFAAVATMAASMAMFTMLSSLGKVSGPFGVNEYIFVDYLNIYLVLVTNVAALTASIFSIEYINNHDIEETKLSEPPPDRPVKKVDWRHYYPIFQLMIFAMNLALLSNYILLMLVAAETGTLATVIMVRHYDTKLARRASWRYFVLSSVGISFALIGTLLLYYAMNGSSELSNIAVTWTNLEGLSR